MDHQKTLSVGLNVAQAYGKTAWGLFSDEDHVLSGEVPGEDEQRAWFAGFEALLSAEALRDRGIDLYCPSQDLCEALHPLRSAFPHLSVQPWTESRAKGLLVRGARKAAFDLIKPAVEESPSTDVDTLVRPRLLVATDGSAGFRRGGSLSGWGWISTAGTFEHGTSPVSDILSAELIAIRQALAGTRRGTVMTVLSDSKAALAVARDLRTGRDLQDFPLVARRGTQMKKVLGAIRDLSADRDVEFAWVPGHSGHVLNEGADRLAVLARRAAQNGVTNDTRTEVARRIAEETLSAFSAAAAA